MKFRAVRREGLRNFGKQMNFSLSWVMKERRDIQAERDHGGQNITLQRKRTKSGWNGEKLKQCVEAKVECLSSTCPLSFLLFHTWSSCWLRRGQRCLAPCGIYKISKQGRQLMSSLHHMWSELYDPTYDLSWWIFPCALEKIVHHALAGFIVI